ncbi:MAG: peptidoglycan-binding domain-containing protein [Patescibacteria group bacterium]
MSKRLIGLAGLLVAVALFLPSGVKAATSAELQLQIDALLSQLAQLQGGGSACFTFTRDLYEGVSGNDVVQLQNHLKSTGHFPVTVNSTGFYGPITVAAVAAWQSGNGVMPPAGYFGAISRAKYNSMCTMTGGDDDDDTTGDDDDDTTGDDDDDDDDDFNSGDGEEADLSDFDSKSGTDSTLEEGQEDGEVLEFEFDVDGSDVEVQRVEVNFNSSVTSGTGEEDPWKAFDGATLWFDGEMVAEVDDLDDEDVWDEEVTNDEWSFRFNGVDVVINDGDTAEFIVAMNVSDSVDGSSTAGANTWLVSIDASGIRALDEAGIDQYTGSSGDDVTVEIDVAGADNELSVTEGDEDPDPTVFEVETGETSDWQTIGIFQVSADGDLELDTLYFDIAAANGSDTYAGLVNDIQLLIDGEDYNDFTVNNSTSATGTVVFDLSDDDVVVDDGEEIDIEVQVEFNALTGNFDEGDNIVLNASSTGVDIWDVEGVSDGEDIPAARLKGSYEGETHTVRSTGIVATLVDTSAVSPVGGDEAQANFEVEFTLEAFGADFWIENSAIVDTSADGTDGVEYAILDSTGTATTGASVSDTLQADGTSAGDNSYGYKISEGSTRTFTLLVTFDNDNVISGAGFYTTQIYGISFDADGVAGSESFISTGLDDYETDDVYVSNDDVAN